MIHLFFGSGGEPHQAGIEVFEYRPVFFEYAAVGLVHDDQIEMRRGEELVAVFGL